MTVIDPPISDLADLQRHLVGRLDDFGRRVRTQLLIEGLARVLAVALVLALLSFGVDRWLRLGLIMRVALLLVGATVIIVQAWRHLLLPLDLRLSPVDLAAALDRHSAESTTDAQGRPLSCSVASILQLPDLLGGSHGSSPAMVRAAVLRSHESLREARFNDRLNDRRRRLATGLITALLLLATALIALSPSSAQLWFRRYFLGSSQPWPQRTYLRVPGLADGKVLVPRGEPSVLLATMKPGSEEPESITVTTRDAGGGKTAGPMTKFAAGDFRFDLPPLQSPLRVQLAGGDDEFGPFTIEPIDRPRIEGLTLTHKHPTELQPKVHNFAGHDADVSFLPRTDLELKFTANVPVADARLKVLPGKAGGPPKPSPKDLHRLDDRNFSLRWTHEQPVNLEIELVGRVGGLISTPTPVTVGLKVDQPPRVTLGNTGVRSRVTPSAKLPLNVQARDDYGLAKVELTIKTDPPPGGTEPFGPAGPATAPSIAPAASRQSVVTLFVPAPGAEDPGLRSTSDPGVLETQHKHVIELSPLGLLPGSVVSITARTTDNCYTGSQTTASRTLTFRVVAPEELFREILLRQQQERGKFRRQIDEAQKVQRDLAAAVSEDVLVNATRQQRLVQREVNRVAETLTESLTEMKLNALGGQEAYDLMEQKILSPLRKLNAELMEPQRDALDRLGKPADAKKVAEAAGRQEQIVARMKEVLAQMAQWDSFVDVLNQLNEVIRIQQQVKQATEQIKDKAAESLFNK